MESSVESHAPNVQVQSCSQIVTIHITRGFISYSMSKVSPDLFVDDRVETKLCFHPNYSRVNHLVI